MLINESTTLSLNQALSIASHLVKFEDFSRSTLKTDKIAVLFDYAELIQ